MLPGLSSARRFSRIGIKGKIAKNDSDKKSEKQGIYYYQGDRVASTGSRQQRM